MDDLFKGLPRHIQIGQYTFKLYVVPAADERLGERDGMTYTGLNKVYLREDMDLQTCLNVVVHELTHCINWARDVADPSGEEEFTTQHTYGLVEMLIRNPRYLCWVNKHVRALRKEAASD